MRYDELRPADGGWKLAVDTLVREGDLAGRRVLDVGCGTGRLCADLAARGSAVTGLDATPEMLAVARDRLPETVVLRKGTAERLPFGDGSFERVAMQLVVHLLDRPEAFREVRRVLEGDGRLAIMTFDPAGFDRFYLTRFFPSVLEIDRRRFPSPELLEEELQEAGFGRVDLLAMYQESERTRDDALVRIRGRYISTLQLVPDDEFAGGLERAERELPERFIVGNSLVFAIAR